MLNSLRYLFYTECLLLLRHSREWVYPLSFFVLTICLFPLAFSPDPAFLQRWLPGCVWIAALFASLQTLQQVFASDFEDSHLNQWLFTPIPLSMIVFTKIAAHWLVTILPLILITPILTCLFGLSLGVSCALALSLLLGTPIVTLIGSLAIALTFGLRQKGMLIGLLMLPLVTPVLIFGVAIVHQVQAGFSISGPLSFLTGCCLLAILCIPSAIAAAIRIGIDD